MNNNYKELNIQKSLYRGCGESFAERLEKLYLPAPDPETGLIGHRACRVRRLPAPAQAL